MSGIDSNRLKQKQEKILSLWEMRAVKEVTSAESSARLALRNSLPIYLDHLSEALATNRKMDFKSIATHDKEAVRIGELHGADRAGTASYSLTELIFEYHILREVIFQVLEVEGPVDSEQRDIILDSIEQAVNDAAVKFSDIHADIQRKFVNTLTHDLKTPLTAAMMNAQMIQRRTENSDECKKSAGRILNNLHRLDSMVHNLLDASRLRAGEQLSLQFVPCNLGEVVREVVDEMSDIGGDRIHFEARDVPEGIYSCDGIRRATENLIGNALKYSPPASPVQVSMRLAESFLELKVHNTGPAIPEEELPLLFQQYRRSKTATESSKTGWGLGLTLVKGVVDAHRGTILVESSDEKGTSFILQIPLSKAV
jgi:signal transduction histidine kinase